MTYDELLASYDQINLEYEKFFDDKSLSKPSYQHFPFVLTKEECKEILEELIKGVQNINE